MQAMPVLQDAYTDVGGRTTSGAAAEQKPVTEKLLFLEAPLSYIVIESGNDNIQMKIEFETDINGYQEARKFKLLIDSILKHEELDQSLNSLASSLQSQLREFLSNPEFSEYSDGGSDELFTASHNELAGAGIVKLFRDLLGPSKREIELSKQRQELIARAEHAEISAFDALAETAEIGRERDQLRERLKQIEAELTKSGENA